MGRVGGKPGKQAARNDTARYCPCRVEFEVADLRAKDRRLRPNGAHHDLSLPGQPGIPYVIEFEARNVDDDKLVGQLILDPSCPIHVQTNPVDALRIGQVQLPESGGTDDPIGVQGMTPLKACHGVFQRPVENLFASAGLRCKTQPGQHFSKYRHLRMRHPRTVYNAVGQNQLIVASGEIPVARQFLPQ